MQEKTLKSTYLYHGKILNLRKDIVLTGHGVEAVREIVEHKPAVVIIPYIKPDKVVLIKQYRKPIEKVLLEVPAGILEEKEDPLVGAKRELAEETGYTAKNIIPLNVAFPSPGFTDEKMYFYLATDLKKGATKMDFDENIETHIFTFSEIDKLIQNFEIEDAKTLVAYLLLKEYLKKDI
jgi:ADP-ribose pyrophosphatase